MQKNSKKYRGLLLAGLMLCLFTGCQNTAGNTITGEETNVTNIPEQTITEIPTMTETPAPTEMPQGDTTLKAYYKLTGVEEADVIKDSSGNGYDGKIHAFTGEEETKEREALFLSDGAYIELPAEVFAGEDTLTISIWLKNYSGSANTSALFFGSKKTMPLNYWLLNPRNPSGNLKSVITDDDNAGAPFNTEVGFSPSAAANGIAGPKTDMEWGHYVTVITPENLTVYYNGKQYRSIKHKKQISEFSGELVAYIGKSSYNDPTYAGFVKELKVYTRELTKEEIQTEYESMTFKEVKSNAVKTDIFIADRADPYITRGSDGYYYFTASYPMYGGADTNGYDRVILRRAETIEGLAEAEEIVIWDIYQAVWAHRYIWAPEIHEIDGKWYVFLAASNDKNNVWAISCHVLVCEGDDPYTDKWRHKGRFGVTFGDTVSFNAFSLDMTYFECNGEHYVIWAQSVGNSSLLMAKIDPKEPWKLTTKPIILSKPEYYWEKVSIPVNEGPAVMVENGKVYVAFSASATGPEYCMGLLYADEEADLMNPDAWTKLSKPLLTSEDLIGEYGPGHNSFVKDENGDWIFVYHSRSEECYLGECGYSRHDPLYDPCRSAHIRKVQWDKDGMPILNR